VEARRFMGRAAINATAARELLRTNFLLDVMKLVLV
jgi:hypothetical protein